MGEGYCCLRDDDRCCSIDPEKTEWMQCPEDSDLDSMSGEPDEMEELDIGSTASKGFIAGRFDYSSASMGMVSLMVFGFFIAGFMYGEITFHRKLSTMIMCNKKECRHLMKTEEGIELAEV